MGILDHWRSLDGVILNDTYFQAHLFAYKKGDSILFY